VHERWFAHGYDLLECNISMNDCWGPVCRVATQSLALSNGLGGSDSSLSLSGTTIGECKEM